MVEKTISERDGVIVVAGMASETRVNVKVKDGPVEAWAVAEYDADMWNIRADGQNIERRAESLKVALEIAENVARRSVAARREVRKMFAAEMEEERKSQARRVKETFGSQK